MVFAGGCPSRNLARAGAGDLRSLVTLLVLGLFAYMAIRGIFAPARAALEQATSVTGLPSQSLGDLLATSARLAPSQAALLVTALLAAAALVYCFGNKGFRASPVHVFSGLAIGLIVVAGWALTGLAYDDMATKPVAPISLTYVRPAGDALQWLALFTADAHAGLRHGQRVRRAARRLRGGAGHGAVPHRHLLRHRRHAAQSRAARR